MADLKTTYMGIPLANPIVVGACSLSKHVDSIKALEAAGTGGLVIKSLFEEQIQVDEDDFERSLSSHSNADPEAQSFFPQLRHGGPKEHIFWVHEVRKAVKLPLFASLNCVNSGTWIEYANLLADTVKQYKRSLDININLIWGIFLIVFGLIMLGLARWAAAAEKAREGK